jgi:hypothetical protein
MNYTKLKQPEGTNDKTSNFVVHKIVKLDNFNRPVLQIALVLPNSQTHKLDGTIL